MSATIDLGEVAVIFAAVWFVIGVIGVAFWSWVWHTRLKAVR